MHEHLEPVWPDLQWGFGKGTAGHRLTVGPEGERQLRPMIDVFLDAGGNAGMKAAMDLLQYAVGEGMLDKWIGVIEPDLGIPSEPAPFILRGGSWYQSDIVACQHEVPG